MSYVGFGKPGVLFNYRTRGEVDPGSGPGMTEYGRRVEHGWMVEHGRREEH